MSVRPWHTFAVEPDRMEWEEKVVIAIQETLDCTHSDANGLADAQWETYDRLWNERCDPTRAAEILLSQPAE